MQERSGPIRVLDLGCGTGLLTTSLMNALPFELQFSLVDVDAAMLAVARERLQSGGSVQSFDVAPAESLPHPDDSFDLVIIGSAWHWMRPEPSVNEVNRVLRSGGGVFICEYQFPKAVELSDLNEWIRVQFNQKWKPATQKPRGTLQVLTECWRQHPLFSQAGQWLQLHQRNHDASELVGVIASQSRYQHFESALIEVERWRAREELMLKLRSMMPAEWVKFQYSYEGRFFKKRR